MISEYLYGKSFVLQILLRGSKLKAIAKISLLLGTLFVFQYVCNSLDNSLFIENGNDSATLTELSDSLIIELYPADNHLIVYLFNFKKYEAKDIPKIKVNVKLKNLQVNSSNRPEESKTIEYHSFKNDKSIEIESILVGRKTKLNIELKPNNTKIIANVAGLGLIEDYANYLQYLAFFLALILLKYLSEKFTFAFTGIGQEDLKSKINDLKDLEINYNGGLLKSVNLSEYDKANDFEPKLKKYIQTIAIDTQFSKRVYYILYAILGIAIIYMSFIFPDSSKEISGNWNFTKTFYPLGYYSNQIKDLFLWLLIIPPILSRVFLIDVFTTKLSRNFEKENQYNINPLSGDRAGGLGPLGEVTLILFYMSICFFPHFFATTIILGNPLSHQILYPFYFLFTFFIFYFPLNSPHRSMKDARRRELDAVAKSYNSAFELFKVSSANSNKIDKDQLETLEKLRELYKQTRTMPVWPYDFELFIKFGALFITNLIIYFSQFTINLLR